VRGVVVAAQAGGYSLTGQPSKLLAIRKLVAQSAIYVFAGHDAGMLVVNPTPIDPDRVAAVAAENRLVAVAGEFRIAIVTAEDRSVGAE
jgi:hypothetical protein